MALIQVKLPKDLDKKIAIEAIKDGSGDKRKVIIKFLKKHFKL